MAIIDLNAKILASSDWQRACTKFHRVHPVTLQRCIESNTRLFRQVEEGRKLSIHRCENGLTDCAAPIIIEGHHVANLFVGQFFTSKPDMAFFRAQQQAMEFDESSYLDAIAEIPVIAEERLPAILQLLTSLASLIATLSMAEYRARHTREQIDQVVSERTQELQEAQRIARLGYWRLDLEKTG